MRCSLFKGFLTDDGFSNFPGKFKHANFSVSFSAEVHTNNCTQTHFQQKKNSRAAGNLVQPVETLRETCFQNPPEVAQRLPFARILPPLPLKIKICSNSANFSPKSANFSLNQQLLQTTIRKHKESAQLPLRRANRGLPLEPVWSSKEVSTGSLEDRNTTEGLHS